MAELPEFQKKQYAFAAHIRDPEHVPAPEGIEDRRMGIYRKLFFNNLRNLLGGMYPVLRRILSDDKWDSLIRQFMQHHQAETPYFLQLPQEFLEFLQHEYELQEDDYPFLVELAHYEYIEIAISISEEENDLTGVDPDGDLIANIPVKSVLSWIYAYNYPVHRISSENLPSEPSDQPVFLAIYRRGNDEVNFLELNPITAGLLEAIDQNEAQHTGEQLLRSLAERINYADVDALIQHGSAALEEMRQLEILTGARLPTEIQDG
jgi:hypothetical protein